MKSQKSFTTSTLFKVIKQNSPDLLDVKKRNSNDWSLEQKKRSLALFRKAAEFVPAYQDFLKKNRVNPGEIKTWDDFVQVPPISKKDYLRKYSLEKVCWNGNLEKPLVFTSTSGSTGEPFYFPRGNELDWQYSLLIEEFLKNSLQKKQGPTLVVICFGMGVWIGGLITYKAFEMAAQRIGTPISIITPGINKKEIFNTLKKLAPHFHTVVLVGYPPFIKDIVDESASQSVDFKKMNVKLLFAAEAFTEEFRSYLADSVRIKNIYLDTLNIYGTADIGAMAYETPLSILIRRIATSKPDLFKDIFGSINKTPTLTQFNPLFINFESVDGNIILTGNNEIPLIRYNVGDHGGVYSYSQMVALLKKHGVDIVREEKKAGIDTVANELPFVFVFERSDLSVTLYGLQIYPEPIRAALLKKPLAMYVTGKFTLETQFDRKQNQYLLIHLEMKKPYGENGIPKVIKRAMVNAITEQLELKNSEYRELHKFIGNRALPRLQFWPAEDPKHFKLGIKQKWVKK